MEKSRGKNALALLFLAAVAGDALAISWEDARKSALTSSPSLQSARAKLDSADAGVESARGNILPRITSTLSAGRSIDTETPSSGNQYSASVNFEQSLFAFGKNMARLDASKAGRDAVRAEARSTSVELRAKLAKAWAKALYLQDLVDITKRNITRREANYQIVKLRYNGGRENKGSVMKTETAKLLATTDSLEATTNLALAKQELSLLIGEPFPENEKLLGGIKHDVNIKGKSGDANSPAVAVSESKLREAKASLREARTRYLPELSLSAAAKKSASPDLPLRGPVFTASVNLTVPLFDYGTSASVRSAVAAASAAAINLKETRASQEHRIKATLSALNFASQRLTLAQKSFEASKLQAEVSRQRYTLGLLSFQDWDSYESELIKSELDVLAAEKTLADARADYHEALGIALEEEP